MQSRDYRDIIGGALVFVTGALTAGHAYLNLPLGTFRNASAGLFPMILGIVLAGFGIAIAVPAFLRTAPSIMIEPRQSFFVLAGIAAFALSIRTLGLLPAIVFLVVISATADTKTRPLQLAGLCIVICILAWLIFRVGLNVPLAMFRLPL